MTDQIEEVKQKTDIVSIIGQHVVLRKAGTNFKGLCPFHSEKTPSFMVSPELQIYKCFGCLEGGDVFTFLEKYEGMDFGEALKYLADKAGIKLQRVSFQDKSGKEILYEINALAAKFYHYLLVTHPVGKNALSYLIEKRKITKKAIVTFNIGFAPDKPNLLFNFLTRKKKYKVSDCLKAGLIVNVRGQYLDRFRGRVIFPILDYRGNTLALAGRILPEYEKKDLAKYINSPETPVYHKGSTLYGLNITRSDIKKGGIALVVEGELDLISSWQIGVKNIVAIKGSALTSDQARILSRFAKEIILALDSDYAGGEAAKRGISILNEFGFDTKVLKLTKFKDPDDAAKADPDGYIEAIKKAIGIWDFLIDLVFSKYSNDSDVSYAKVSREITPILASIPDKIVQAHYINLVSQKLNVPPEAVSEEVENHKEKVTSKAAVKFPEDVKAKSPRQMREERLVSLVFQKTPSLFKSKDISSLITTPLMKRIVVEALKYLEKNKNFNTKEFSQGLPKELFEGFSNLVLKSVEDEGQSGKELQSVYKKLFDMDTREKIKSSLKEDDPKSQKEYKMLSQKLKDFKDIDFERIIQETK